MKLTSKLLKKLIKETMLQEEQEQELEKALEAAVAELPPEIVIAAASEEEPLDEQPRDFSYQARKRRAASGAKKVGIPNQRTFNKDPEGSLKPGSVTGYQAPQYRDFSGVPGTSDRMKKRPKSMQFPDKSPSGQDLSKIPPKVVRDTKAKAKKMAPDLQRKAKQKLDAANAKNSASKKAQVDRKIAEIQKELNSRAMSPVMVSAALTLLMGLLAGPFGAILMAAPIGVIITKISNLIGRKATKELQSQLQSAQAEKSEMQETIDLSEEQIGSIVEEELAALMKERKL